MNRIVEAGANYELAIMKNLILSLPRMYTAADALLILPGQGEWPRLHGGIQLAEDSRIGHLMIAGHTQTEREYVAFDVDKLRAYGLKRDSVDIQVHAWHTGEQAEWVVDRTLATGIKSLVLAVSDYHLPRAYLTILKAFLRREVQPIPMIPYPIPVSPLTISPLNGVPHHELIAGELDRILAYQEKGFVATLAELTAHINRMWSEFPPFMELGARSHGLR
jgi:uncharacterized SAM-binding protein YcdF (DUF218 family)